jgi:hypothetical protein
LILISCGSNVEIVFFTIPLAIVCNSLDTAKRALKAGVLGEPENNTQTYKQQTHSS